MLILLAHAGDAGASRPQEQGLFRNLYAVVCAHLVPVGAKPARELEAHAGFDGRGRCARLDATDQRQPVGFVVCERGVAVEERLGVERQKEVGRGAAQRVSEETRRRDAHDGERLVVQIEDAADDRRVAAEPLHPQAIAHHRRWRRSGPIIGRRQRAPGVGRNAEHREVIAGDALSRIGFGSLGLACAPHAKGALAGREGRQLRKARRPVAELREELVGDERKLLRLGVATPVAATRFPAQAIQLAGFPHWKRLQQHGVDEREDRRCRADAEREDQHRRDRERRRQSQATQRVTSVLDEGVERRQPSFLAPAFSGRVDRAKLQDRLPPRLHRRQPGALVFGGLQRQVILDFRGQALVGILPGHPGAEPPEEALHGSHRRSSAFTAKNRPMIAAVCSQPTVSARSCLRPSRVSR